MPLVRYAAQRREYRGSGVGGQFALQFPSNSAAVNTSDPYAVIEFANPQSNGLPIWGASNAGVTMVRRVRTPSTMQPGYSAQIWWSRANGTFDASEGYWGCHPYPARGYDQTNDFGPGGSGYFIHEMGCAGTDTIDSSGTNWSSGMNSAYPPTLTNGTVVTTDTTYVQGLRITRANADDKTLRYYFNLPSVASANTCVLNVTTTGYGETNPPSPKLTIGDSPWYASNQHERFGGTLDSIKIFAAALTEQEMLDEAADFSSIVTAAGASAIWWGRNGFDTGHDTNGGTIACSYSTGRQFAIVNPSGLSAHRINLVSRV